MAEFPSPKFSSWPIIHTIFAKAQHNCNNRSDIEPPAAVFRGTGSFPGLSRHEVHTLKTASGLPAPPHSHLAFIWFSWRRNTRFTFSIYFTFVFIRLCRNRGIQAMVLKVLSILQD
jgi:hypothetical protein